MGAITFPFRVVAYLFEFSCLVMRYQLTWGAVITRTDRDIFYGFKGAEIEELRARWRMPHRGRRSSAV